MVAVRPALSTDHAAFARLLPLLGTGDPIPSEELFDREMRDDTLVAELDGETVGALLLNLLRETLFVRVLVTSDAVRRRGVGEALLRSALERGRRAGCTTWCLNVKPDNEAAITLYKKMGLRRAHASVVVRVPWTAVEGVQPATIRAIEPDEDEALERLHGVERGMLAEHRGRGGRVLAALEHDGGVAIFDPAFPGSYPFRPARAELALPLLAALRPHARAEDAHLKIMVEGRPDVVAALLTAGGVKVLDIEHMRALLVEP
jgi:GNAT superfamily N-acetyltransferase